MDWPSGIAEIKSTAGNKESAASFWQANFSGPWTWLAPLLSPYPNFFTPSYFLGDGLPDINQMGQHFIGGGDDFGIDLISPLDNNHFD